LIAGISWTSLPFFTSAQPSTRLFEDDLKEGLKVAPDLSREQWEFHPVEQGLVLSAFPSIDLERKEDLDDSRSDQLVY